MKMRYMAFGIAIGAVLTLAGTPRLSAQSRNVIEGSFNRTLSISGPAALEVATGSGGIDIRQGATGQVEIRGRIRVGTDRNRSDREAEDIVRDIESRPPVEQTGSTVRIGRLQGRDYDRNVSISYEIVVPAETSVRADTGSGGITLTNLRGKVTSHTGSGSIHAENIAGPFTGTTGSGGVILRQTAPGDVEISTGSGTVQVSGVKGALRVHTGSGGIAAQGEQSGRWELETSSGSIEVRLPQNAGFELSAHTGSGGVQVNFPITMQGRLDSRRDVSGRIGGGGHALDVRTGSGSIRIG